MPLIINLDVMLAKRKMKLQDLASQVGITPQNLSVLKTGRAKAIRFSTLEALCRVLECQPGDIFSPMRTYPTRFYEASHLLQHQSCGALNLFRVVFYILKGNMLEFGNFCFGHPV